MMLLKMLMEIAVPKMGELLVMMMTMISPSGREVPRRNRSARRVKVLMPKFRLETAALRPDSLLLNFSSSNDLYTRRWAPEVGLGEHNPPGRAWAPWGIQVGCAHLVATRARLGSLGHPGGLCPPGGPPLVFICSNNS